MQPPRPRRIHLQPTQGIIVSMELKRVSNLDMDWFQVRVHTAIYELKIIVKDRTVVLLTPATSETPQLIFKMLRGGF